MQKKRTTRTEGEKNQKREHHNVIANAKQFSFLDPGGFMYTAIFLLYSKKRNEGEEHIFPGEVRDSLWRTAF